MMAIILFLLVVVSLNYRMENCIVYDENVCGQPQNKPEELISFQELDNVNSAHTEYPELNGSFWIKSRIGVAAKDSDAIFPFHGAKFDKDWRSSRLCTYPDHHHKSNSGLRALPIKEYHFLSECFPNQTIPFGSLICTTQKEKIIVKCKNTLF